MNYINTMEQLRAQVASGLKCGMSDVEVHENPEIPEVRIEVPFEKTAAVNKQSAVVMEKLTQESVPDGVEVTITNKHTEVEDDTDTTMSQSPDRELPDEQSQIDDEDRDEDAALQTMDRAMSLSEQFEEVKDRTVDDSTVLGTVDDIHTSENSSKVIIEIDVPGDASNISKRFRKPKVWSERYKMVRWMKHYGYDADSFPNMLEDDCKVKVFREGDREYELFIPEWEGEEDETWSEKFTYYSGRAMSHLDPVIRSYVTQRLPLISCTLTVGVTIIGVMFASGILETGMADDPLFGVFIITYLLLVVMSALERSYLKGRSYR